MAGLQLGLVGAYASQAIADSDHSALTIRPAFLPIPNTMDESGDPKEFRPAVLSAVLHVFLSCKGGVKEAEFEAVRQWLVAQGFTIVRALGPEAGRTYPSIRFNGTVRQFNEAFHITVMSKLLHPRYCYAVFTDWMMPARFAPKGAEYIQDYEFSSDGDPGLSTLCH